MKHSMFMNQASMAASLISTTILLTDRIRSKHLLGTRFENFYAKNDKRGVLIRAGGWKHFQKLISGGTANRH